MAINIFVVSIIVLSIFFTNMKVEEKVQKREYVNIPLVVFEDSIMYDINEKEISNIVQSRQALNYEDRDELYDATIISRNNTNTSDNINAEYILKQKGIYKLYQNVSISQGENITLMSDYIEYDSIKKIAKNNVEFLLSYNESELAGTNLYFDAINEIIKAKDSHFKIKLKEKTK
ncbi:MAG TPA: hypothetical protein EYG97_03530 [Arcobacter sp.]|nr:hypothetical protein [Arcobacter sp.]HIP56073.1 hypothetical protein [Arcobacter sp.]